MNDDHDLLDALDRRAMAARAAVDARLEADPPPEVRWDGPRATWRRLVAPALVAAVVAVALAAVALVARDGDGATTIAGSGESTHLVLPDPASEGYDVTVAFDGSGAPGAGAQDVPVTVQGPIADDDPWAAAVLEYSLPADATTRSGEEVDIGGPAATFDTSGVAPTVAWDDGDVVRFLVSTRVGSDELLALAREVVAGEIASGQALPGHEVLFGGVTSDVLPVLATELMNDRGLTGVAYSTSAGDSGLVIATVAGDDARWRAASAAATTVATTTVRGQQATIASYQLGLSEVSWLEDDGTLVRVDALRGDAGALVPLLDDLVEIDDDDFADLVAQSPGPDDAPLPEPGDGSPRPGTLARVQLDHDGGSLTASIVDEGRTPTLETEIRDASGTLATSLELTGLAQDVAVREVMESGGVVVTGLIGPEVTRVEIRDAATEAVVEGEGPSTAVVPGSDHILFMSRVGAAWAELPLVAVGITADGEEVRVPF